MKKTVECFWIGALAVITATAVLFSACEFGFDIRPEERAAGFVPVTDITGVPASGQPYISIALSATVVPANATNKRIVWSIANSGTTGAVLDEARLTAASEGTVTVTATITNGLGGNVDYTQDFDIQISLTAIYAVQEIYGIPDALPIGDFTYTLNGKISPANASYRDIVWSVIDDGGTGATINGDYLSAQRKGTVRVRAAIANGRLTSDYTQDFSILISRGIVAAGSYEIGYNKACYWVAGQRIDLPDSNEESFTTGIVYVGDKQFISGYYINGVSIRDPTINLCYWVDGVQTTIPNITISGYYYNGILSIAAGGGYVYILGYDGSNWRYWKIDANNGNIAYTAGLSNYTGDDMVNPIVVKSDGSAVIAGLRGGDYANCYWLSDDSKSTIDPVQITALDYNQGFSIQCAGLVGGEVYFAGLVRDDNYLYPYPFYYRLGASACNVSPIKNIKFNRVNSIVNQNGVPVFYGGYRYYTDLPTGYSWDTGWNFKNLLNIGTPSEKHFSLDTVVYLDGDAYAVMNPTDSPHDCYALLKEPYPYRSAQAPVAAMPGNTKISGIVVINDDMLGGKTFLVGSVGSITVQNWLVGEPISLAAPPVNFFGQTVTAQGWQISDDGNNDWTEFTLPPTASMSHNGKYLRYYAAGSSGLTYYSNTVRISVFSATAREITIRMFAGYGYYGWANAALRINVNGSDLPTNATILEDTNAESYAEEYYEFMADTGDEVKIYWVHGSRDYYCAFAVYYTDAPAVGVDPGYVETGGNILVSKKYEWVSQIEVADGTEMGSFTVTAR